MNHLMLHKLGIKAFYRQSFLADICEVRQSICHITATTLRIDWVGKISEIRPSNVWYEERTDFSPKVSRNTSCQPCKYRFWLVTRQCSVWGEILGGCLESLSMIFLTTLYMQMAQTSAKKYKLPWLIRLGRKNPLAEIQPRKPNRRLQKMLRTLKETGIFEVISGLLVRKTYGWNFLWRL